MAYSGKIFYKKHPEATMKVLKKAVKDELKGIVFDWHEDTLSGHFTPQAAAKYRYAKRTEKYLKAKQKKFGHRNPLVYTGNLKRQSTRSVRVTGTSKKATGRMPVPTYLFFKKGAVDMKKEIIAVAKPEIVIMARNLQTRIGKKLDEAKPTAPIVRRF